MSAKEFKQREADQFSTRRARLDKERKREFDEHYGKQQGDGVMRKGRRRGAGGAGKGDARRPASSPASMRRAEISYELAFDKTLTPKQRKELEQEWESLRGK